MTTTDLIEQLRDFAANEFYIGSVRKAMRDSADEIERLQKRNALLEDVAAAAKAVSLFKGQTLLGCAPDNDYPNVPGDEMKAHEYGAYKAFNQCASVVEPALDRLWKEDESLALHNR